MRSRSARRSTICCASIFSFVDLRHGTTTRGADRPEKRGGNECARRVVVSLPPGLRGKPGQNLREYARPSRYCFIPMVSVVVGGAPKPIEEARAGHRVVLRVHERAGDLGLPGRSGRSCPADYWFCTTPGAMMLNVTSGGLIGFSRVVVAGAQRPAVVQHVLDADLPHVDVLPAEAGAVAAAEAVALAGRPRRQQL